MLRLDHAIGLSIEMWLDIRIEEPFTVTDATGSVFCDPGEAGAVGPITDFYGKTVTRARVYKDGSMRLEFADDRTLAVPAGAHYEAFQVTGSWSDGEPWRLISLPGGGLAEWVAGER